MYGCVIDEGHLGKAGGSPEVAQCKGEQPGAVEQAIETGLAFVKGKTEK